MDSGLKNKVVIVTGGAAGIGRATVLRFAEEGCRVAVWDLGDAGSLLEEIAAAGGQGVFARVDVSNGEALRAAVEEVLARWGRIDVLVNNAGIVRDGQLVKWKDGAVASVLDDQA